LMTTIRHNLTDAQYYLCSSYYENIIAGRPDFDDIVVPNEVLFVFGHFVQDSLISIFRHRKIYLFTGLRQPIRRAISHLNQLNTIRSRGSLPLLTAEEYLAENANGTCEEILRAFPYLRDEVPGESKFEKARALLSLFDYVYDSDRFGEHIHHILASIDLSSAQILSDNVTAEKGLDADLLAFNQTQAERLKQLAPDALHDDLALFEYFKPYLGIGRLRFEIAGEPWSIPRERLFAKFGGEEDARQRYCEFEAGHLVYEFYLLGKLPFLKSTLEARIGRAERLLQIAADYGVDIVPKTP